MNNVQLPATYRAQGGTLTAR